MAFTEEQTLRLLKNATPGSEFYIVMKEYLEILRSIPRCASCGKTDNLTPGYAGGNEISYCPRCKRDEEQR